MFWYHKLRQRWVYFCNVCLGYFKGYKSLFFHLQNAHRHKNGSRTGTGTDPGYGIWKNYVIEQPVPVRSHAAANGKFRFNGNQNQNQNQNHKSNNIKNGFSLPLPPSNANSQDKSKSGPGPTKKPKLIATVDSLFNSESNLEIEFSTSKITNTNSVQNGNSTITSPQDSGMPKAPITTVKAFTFQIPLENPVVRSEQTEPATAIQCPGSDPGKLSSQNQTNVHNNDGSENLVNMRSTNDMDLEIIFESTPNSLLDFENSNQNNGEMQSATSPFPASTQDHSDQMDVGISESTLNVDIDSSLDVVDPMIINDKFASIETNLEIVDNTIPTLDEIIEPALLLAQNDQDVSDINTDKLDCEINYPDIINHEPNFSSYLSDQPSIEPVQNTDWYQLNIVEPLPASLTSQTNSNLNDLMDMIIPVPTTSIQNPDSLRKYLKSRDLLKVINRRVYTVRLQKLNIIRNVTERNSKTRNSELNVYQAVHNAGPRAESESTQYREEQISISPIQVDAEISMDSESNISILPNPSTIKEVSRPYYKYLCLQCRSRFRTIPQLQGHEPSCDSSNLSSSQDADHFNDTCPECGKLDDGSKMIFCDVCFNWFHSTCLELDVGTISEDAQIHWACPNCNPKECSSNSVPIPFGYAFKPRNVNMNSKKVPKKIKFCNICFNSGNPPQMEDCVSCVASFHKSCLETTGLLKPNEEFYCVFCYKEHKKDMEDERKLMSLQNLLKISVTRSMRHRRGQLDLSE